MVDLVSQLCECLCGGYAKPGKRFIKGHACKGKTKEDYPKLANSGRKKSGKPKPEPQLCECLCGGYAAPGKRFIIGHSGKMQKKKPKSEPELCWCHCGGYAKPGNKYIKGHNRKNKPGAIPWCKGLTKETSEILANAGIKSGNSRKGHYYKDPDWKHSEESKKQMSESQLGKIMTEETNKKISQTMTGVPKSKEHIESFLMSQTDERRKQESETMLRLWADKEYRAKQIARALNLWADPEWKDEQVRKMRLACGTNKGPNKPESKIDKITARRFPTEWMYTGDYQMIIGGKCPDFTNINGQKKLIEVFGDYWHRGEDPQVRIDFFKNHGWDCLVIWEHEIKEDIKAVERKIVEFHNKPKKDQTFMVGDV